MANHTPTPSVLLGHWAMGPQGLPEASPRWATPAPAPWGDAWAQEALEALQDLRPCLPGEALPPEPPAWGAPGPELPALGAL